MDLLRIVIKNDARAVSTGTSDGDPGRAHGQLFPPFTRRQADTGAFGRGIQYLLQAGIRIDLYRLMHVHRLRAIMYQPISV